jgi:hypothetical protein
VSLARTQALFSGLVTGAGAPAGAAGRILAGSPHLPAADRLAVYAGMYRARLAEALREDHPKLAALIGEERFGALADAYALAHPSDHHDLGRFGRHLAGFLRRSPAPDRPDLADLAALEWARAEVHLEADAEPSRRGALAALGPESFASARLALVPALRLLSLEHDAASLWRRLEDGAPPGPPAPSPTAVAVWRAGFEVFHARLDPDEAEALARAASGEPLAAVCAAFERREDPAGAAFAALGSWLDEGWVASVSA